MKKFLSLFFILTLVVPAAARAEDRPINISLVDPVQITDNTYGISAFRLNILYGKNAGMQGLDLGIGVGHSTNGFAGLGLHYGANFVQGDAKGVQFSNIINLDMANFTGVQFAGANYVHGDANAFQIAYASITKGDFSGVAIGAANIVQQNAKGVKLGVFNMVSENFKGLQLGLVNIAGLDGGLQIGLVNINKNKKPLPFFIIVNWG